MNWFSRVDVTEDGDMALAVGHSTPGANLTLRFEMDTLALMHTCPHPLDASPEYPSKPIAYALDVAPPVAADDPCRVSREENGRGFMNNALYLLGTNAAQSLGESS